MFFMYGRYYAQLFFFYLQSQYFRFIILQSKASINARAFLHILCIVMVGMSYQMPVNSGIIKGGGDTKYAMI